jgi:hypothetical protein
MAYVTHHRTSAVHASAERPVRRFAWGRLLALAATIGLWAAIVAAARAVVQTFV